MIRVQGFRLDWLLDVQPLLESNGGVEVKPRGQEDAECYSCTVCGVRDRGCNK